MPVSSSVVFKTYRLMVSRLIRKKRHIREVEKYLDMLMIDNVNLSLHASRFGWTEELQHQLTNSALLIRKYQRRLRLIRM
jgi:hypothetical protein